MPDHHGQHESQVDDEQEGREGHERTVCFQPTRRLQNASSPDAVAGVQQIMKAIHAGGVPQETLELVHMRTSQINGCNACIASGITNAERIGLSSERLLTLPAWRESALYDDAERAALGLAEAMTRLADHPEVSALHGVSRNTLSAAWSRLPAPAEEVPGTLGFGVTDDRGNERNPPTKRLGECCQRRGAGVARVAAWARVHRGSDDPRRA